MAISCEEYNVFDHFFLSFSFFKVQILLNHCAFTEFRDTFLILRAIRVDLHLTRNLFHLFHNFSWNFGSFELYFENSNEQFVSATPLKPLHRIL